MRATRKSFSLTDSLFMIVATVSMDFALDSSNPYCTQSISCILQVARAPIPQVREMALFPAVDLHPILRPSC